MIVAILALLGVGLVVAGVALISVPWSLIVAGALLLAVAFLFYDPENGGGDA